MSEQVKTIIYIVVAGVSLLVAWVARPASPSRDPLNDTGEAFFADFTDPLDAASLEIVEFDEDTASPKAFSVARHDGVWSIPSHENYAADAENQFAKAATSMIGLIKGSIVSDLPSDHELYGVIDPTQAEPGAIGVGTRITLEKETSQTLANLIIGKLAKGQDNQYFVREPGRVRVYLCTIDTDNFSTRFEDWIERDLLQLDSNEIAQVAMNDYSIDELNEEIIQGDKLVLSYDKDERTWSIGDLAENETLLDSKLNEMKRALDDLEIVDVHRKPAGLSSELRAEDQLNLDRADIGSLQSRGYFIDKGGRLLSNKGETYVRMNNGVQYVLRFGEIALGVSVPETAEDAGDASSTGGASRYLFVTATFNPDLIPQPDIQTVPDFSAIPGVSELTPPSGDDDSAGEDELPGAQESAESQEADDRIAEAFKEASRKIEADNQREQQAYDEKVEQGQQRVRELNDRFADWYYVMSDSAYQKIRLKRSDVVESSEPVVEETEAPLPDAEADGSVN